MRALKLLMKNYLFVSNKTCNIAVVCRTYHLEIVPEIVLECPGLFWNFFCEIA